MKKLLLTMSKHSWPYGLTGVSGILKMERGCIRRSSRRAVVESKPGQFNAITSPPELLRLVPAVAGTQRSFLKWVVLSLITITCFLSPLTAQSAGLERLPYHHPGLAVDLGVGLWAWPLPMDYDEDGDYDLVVACPDKPYNGTYLFENPGNDEKMPVFKPARRIGPGRNNISPSYVEGQPRVLVPGAELHEFRKNLFGDARTIYPEEDLVGGRTRANQWKYLDYENDGALDLIVGVGVWSDYGWDDAFDSSGTWTNGPLHGFVYLIRNQGTTQNPDYAEPVKLQAGNQAVDVFGMPSPNFADFDGDGDLDLLCGEFRDTFTYFENTGSRAEPQYAPGRKLMLEGEPLTMDLCMIVPVSLDWDKDGDPDLVVGQEDGRVAFIENAGNVVDGLPAFKPPQFFQQEADSVKFGALVTPVGFDWDHDGDEDIVAGNTAGRIAVIENLGPVDGSATPRWAAPVRLEAAGRTIRIQAGYNGSIQGPAEAEWGYTTLDVADWDHDGLPDLIVNSILGKVVWYRNVGSRSTPRLVAAQPIEVAWDGKPPKPKWNWWDPEDNHLVTQWRTTPVVRDWDGDGLNDLIMLDHEGYLALFHRRKTASGLVLLAGERVFENAEGDLLRLNSDSAGGSGRRKLTVVDWDNDGQRDILINSRNVNFLRNVSDDRPPWKFEVQGQVDARRLAGHTTSPTTVDWNRDGVRDLLVGGEDGFMYYMRNPH